MEDTQTLPEQPARAAAALSEGSQTFDSVDDAVAEIERRAQERRAANKAEKAAKAEAEKAEAEEEDTDDEPKQKAKADDEDESSDEDEAPEESDEEATDDDEEDDPKEKRKEATSEADDDTEEVEDDKGQKHRVPRALKDSFLRQADYSRKTQELAAERQATQQSFQQAQAVAQQLQQQHALLAQFAQGMLGQEPPLELAHTNVSEYMVQKGLYEQRQKVLNEIVQQQQRAQQHQQALQQQQVQQSMAQNLKAMVDARPELRDPAKREAFGKDVIAGASAFGFSQQDVAQIHDHRTLQLLEYVGKAKAAEDRSAKASKDVKKALANVPPKQSKPAASAPESSKSQKAEKAKRAFMNSARSERDLRRYLAQIS